MKKILFAPRDEKRKCQRWKLGAKNIFNLLRGSKLFNFIRNDNKMLLKLNSLRLYLQSYQLSESGLYAVPLLPSRVNSLELISTMPLTPSPEVFGLHENADITKNFNETNNVSFSTFSVAIIHQLFFVFPSWFRAFCWLRHSWCHHHERSMDRKKKLSIQC